MSHRWQHGTPTPAVRVTAATLLLLLLLRWLRRGSPSVIVPPFLRGRSLGGRGAVTAGATATATAGSATPVSPLYPATRLLPLSLGGKQLGRGEARTELLVEEHSGLLTMHESMRRVGGIGRERGNRVWEGRFRGAMLLAQLLYRTAFSRRSLCTNALGGCSSSRAILRAEVSRSSFVCQPHHAKEHEPQQM